MKATRLAALIGKELREALRAGWANIPATALLTVLLLVAKTPHGASGAAALLQTRLAVFLPLLAMPFYASTVLSRAIQTERLRGGLLPLFIYGGSTAEVWLAKVLGASILAYVVMLLSLGGYLGYGLQLGRDVIPPWSALPHLFVTMPVAALSLIALQAALFWMMGRSSLLSVIVPLVVMFGGAQLVVLLGLRPISPLTAVLAMLASCAVVATLVLIVHHYPRERAAGIATG
jgi:hypothetical protein